MNPSEDTILIGLPVHTVAEIADCAGSLQRVARWQPDGKVAGLLVRGRGRVVEGTEASFNTEELAVAHMEDLVTACVAWRNSHVPARMADACFSC